MVHSSSTDERNKCHHMIRITKEARREAALASTGSILLSSNFNFLLITEMGILQVSSTILTPSQSFNYTTKPVKFLHVPSQLSLTTRRRRRPRAAAETATESSSSPEEEEVVSPEEPPSIDFAFVHSRLLPDGMPDIALRSACGGRKLRDIMLDCHIDLYGPYDKPLSNCSGGGTCGTCLVEVVDGKEFLSPRTDKEEELLKRKPKSWRLACQTTVGNQDSRGQVVIQQLPEWKAHEWE